MKQVVFVAGPGGIEPPTIGLEGRSGIEATGAFGVVVATSIWAKWHGSPERAESGER